jgi:hypothetical protein
MELYMDVQGFLWTKQLDGQTEQKRILLAKRRLAVGLQMGDISLHT